MEAPTIAACPPENQFVSLLEGRLAGDALEAIEEHVDTCGACTSLLYELACVLVPDPEPRSAAAATRTLGRYQILGEVGTGAMGVVYAAFDPELRRKVALKILRPDLGVASLDVRTTARARLLREARLLANLAHPNVVAIYDVGAAGEDVFLAVELIEGRSLAEWQREERPGWLALARAYAQAARGLGAAHSKGLIHRDVKPANIMIGHDGRVRVTDFGLALASQDGARSGLGPASRAETSLHTQSNLVLGTPAYMAPEQLAGRRVDARADQYALAVALGEALTGERPMPGATADDLEEAARAGERGPLPRAVLAVVERGTRPRSADRFADMDALVEALEAAIAGLDATTPRAITSRPEPAPVPRRKARGVSSVLWAVIAMTGLGAGAWAYLGGGAILGAGSPAETATTALPTARALAIAEPPAATRALAPEPTVPATALPSQAQEDAPVASALRESGAVGVVDTAKATSFAAAPTPASTLSPARSSMPLVRDERAMVLVMKAHRHADSREGAACLAALAELEAHDARRAARSDVVKMRAQCEMHAGDCAAGRRRLRALLDPSYQGADLDMAVDANSTAACRKAQAIEPTSTLASPSRVALEARLNASLTEAQKSGDCGAVKQVWLQRYRLLYPELIAGGLDPAAMEGIFFMSYPQCKKASP